MTDAFDPQSQLAPSDEGEGTPDDVRTGAPTPSPEELNAQLQDGSGNAVSAQPTDIDPADLDDARARSGWDESTNESSDENTDRG